MVAPPLVGEAMGQQQQIPTKRVGLRDKHGWDKKDGKAWCLRQLVGDEPTMPESSDGEEGQVTKKTEMKGTERCKWKRKHGG